MHLIRWTMGLETSKMVRVTLYILSHTQQAAHLAHCILPKTVCQKTAPHEHVAWGAHGPSGPEARGTRSAWGARPGSQDGSRPH